MLKRINRAVFSIGDALAWLAAIVAFGAVVVGIPLALLYAVVRVLRLAWTGQ